MIFPCKINKIVLFQQIRIGIYSFSCDFFSFINTTEEFSTRRIEMTAAMEEVLSNLIGREVINRT